MTSLETQKKQSKTKPIHIQRRTRNQPKSLTPSPHAILQRAQADPQSLRPEDVLQLQRTLGNQVTMNALSMNGGMIQRKGFWGKAFDRLFGVSQSTRRNRVTKFSPKPIAGVSAIEESRRFKRDFRRQMRGEHKAISAFVWHNYHGATREQRQRKEVEKSGNFNDIETIGLSEIIKNEMAWALFRKFSRSEYSSENANFLDFALDRAKVGVDSDSGLNLVRETITNRQAVALYYTFIKAGSSYEINVSGKTRKKLSAEIEQMISRIQGVKSQISQSSRERSDTEVERESGGPTYRAAPVAVEDWDSTVNRDLLVKMDKAVTEIWKMLIDTTGRFTSSEWAKYAFRAIQTGATLQVWAPQYRQFMDAYVTEAARAENTVSKSNTPWWKR